MSILYMARLSFMLTVAHVRLMVHTASNPKPKAFRFKSRSPKNTDPTTPNSGPHVGTKQGPRIHNPKLWAPGMVPYPGLQFIPITYHLPSKGPWKRPITRAHRKTPGIKEPKSTNPTTPRLGECFRAWRSLARVIDPNTTPGHIPPIQNMVQISPG